MRASSSKLISFTHPSLRGLFIRVCVRKAAFALRELSEGLWTWDDVWSWSSQRWNYSVETNLLFKFGCCYLNNY
ncbi:hypothetical protein M0R45_011186 [Rubus argutus]|uniref:Uncharacterized protein n=1 Tax=Rubus argutus TaxID=59490 RepID=A0AAW1YA18_RUBAR